MCAPWQNGYLYAVKFCNKYAVAGQTSRISILHLIFCHFLWEKELAHNSVNKNRAPFLIALHKLGYVSLPHKHRYSQTKMRNWYWVVLIKGWHIETGRENRHKDGEIVFTHLLLSYRPEGRCLCCEGKVVYLCCNRYLLWTWHKQTEITSIYSEKDSAIKE